MPNINCSATNCAYNKQATCYKSKVNVEGLFTRSKLGTFCESFKSPKEKALFEYELGNDMTDDTTLPLDTKTTIVCSANYCYFNKNNKCNAKNIKVGTHNAKYRSETECDSFQLK